MFDKLTYDKSFVVAIKSLTASEKTTKAILLDLSRSTLEALHSSEDIGYVNRLLDVLTPMNKATAVLYFKEFTGFHFDADSTQFGKKDKKTYTECADKTAKFLDDPLNNIWSWATRNVEVQKKEFSLDAVTTYITATLKKADKAGFKQGDVLAAIFKAGFTPESIMALVGEKV